MGFMRYLVLTFAALLLGVVNLSAAECSPKHDVEGIGVRIEDLSRVTHLSTSGVNLWLKVRNDRPSRVVLKRAVVEMAVDGVTQVEMSLRDKVVVRGRRTEEVLVPLRFESRRTLSFARVLRKALVDGKGEGLTISFKLRGGTLFFRRTITEDNITLRDVATLLDMDFLRFIGELEKITE